MKYKIYDLSIPIKSNMLKWPSDPDVKVEQLSFINKGDRANFSKVDFGVHTGTHIDAPYHFYNQGLKIDELSLYDLIGEVLVVETESPVINKKFLKTIDLRRHKRVLFKTLNTGNRLLKKKKFSEDYVYISKDGAKYLASKKVKLIGIDYLSIEEYKSKNADAHKIITKNNIIIIETLDLSKIKPGEYLLIALPVKIKNSDGAPARVVLIKFNND